MSTIDQLLEIYTLTSWQGGYNFTIKYNIKRYLELNNISYKNFILWCNVSNDPRGLIFLINEYGVSLASYKFSKRILSHILKKNIKFSRKLFSMTLYQLAINNRYSKEKKNSEKYLKKSAKISLKKAIVELERKVLKKDEEQFYECLKYICD